MRPKIAVSNSANLPKILTTVQAAQHIRSASSSYDMHDPHLIQTYVQVLAPLRHGDKCFH